jgi:hypothetical protein
MWCGLEPLVLLHIPHVNQGLLEGVLVKAFHEDVNGRMAERTSLNLKPNVCPPSVFCLGGSLGAEPAAASANLLVCE